MNGFKLEVIVVDDGSKDPQTLQLLLQEFPETRLLTNADNKGKAHAVNRGIQASTLDYLIQLDADDFMMPDWQKTIRKIIDQVEPRYNVILAGCVNVQGHSTSSVPRYCGEQTLADRIRGTYRGEYLAIFKGDFIRQTGFSDLGIRRASYEEYSYLQLLRSGPFWIVPQIVRVYTEDNPESLSQLSFSALRAAERVKHLDSIIADFGTDFMQIAPRRLGDLYLKRAIYKKSAGLPDSSADWLRAFKLNPVTALLASGLLLFSPALTQKIVGILRAGGIIQRYG